MRTAFPTAVLLFLLTASNGSAQAPEKWLGSWKMNPAKSTVDPGVPPPSRVQKLSQVAEGLRILDDKVDFHGNESKLEYTVPLDGQAIPFPQLDGASVKFNRIDDYSFDVILNWNTPAGTGTVITHYAVSRDGKTLTAIQLTSQRKRQPNAPLKESTVRLVFDRRP